MAKKEEILKTIILFLFFLFGCNHKYINVEGESLDERIVASWEELGCKVVGQNKKSFLLNSQVKYMAIIKDSVGGEGNGRRWDSERGNILPLLGGLIGYFGCLGGYYYVKSQDYLTEENLELGCLISSVSCLTGLVMIVGGDDNNRKVAMDINYFIKRYTVCVDSVPLSKEEVKVVVKNVNFEKKYYTDEKGNIELKFDEMLAEPKKTNFRFKVIIHYEDMVDSVNLRIINEED